MFEFCLRPLCLCLRGFGSSQAICMIYSPALQQSQPPCLEDVAEFKIWLQNSRKEPKEGVYNKIWPQVIVEGS